MASSSSSPGLLSLSYDALLDLLPFLDATSRGMLACASRLFSLLVKEARNHELMFVTCRGSKDAIKTAIKRELPCQPSVGLLFRQPRMTEAHVKDLLASLPKDIQMVGSTTRDVLCVPKAAAPVATGDGVLTLMHFPETTARTFFASDRTVLNILSQQEKEGLRADVMGQLGLDPTADYKVFMIFSPMPGDPLDAFLEVLQGFYPKSTIVGGIAEVAFRVNPMTRGGVESTRNGVVGLALAGNVPLHALVSRGTIPFSPTLELTSYSTISRRLGVGGLTGELLVASTVRRADGEGGDMSIEDALSLNVVSGNRSVDYDSMCCGIREVGASESFLIKDFYFTDEGGDMMIPVSKQWFQDVSQDSSPRRLQVRFFCLDEEASKKDVQMSMQRLAVEVEAVSQRLEGALMFSCNGRGPKSFLGLGENSVDLTAFQEAFPEVPISGFYAYGEIGPEAMYRDDCTPSTSLQCTQTGNVARQAFTVMLLAFITPRRTMQRASIYAKVHGALTKAHAPGASPDTAGEEPQ